MKKFIVFILAILYLGLSTGATVHMHFCMGKLVGSSLWHNDKSDLCSKCGMQKKASKNKCCKDEHKIVKIEQDQNLSITVDHIVDLASIVFDCNKFIIPGTFISSSIEKASFSNAPPFSYKTPIYIRNCVFRI
jgi:hypothetical protein